MIHTDPPVVVADQAPFGIVVAVTVILGCACDKTDREFQSFALMDTHDPYDIGIFIKDIGLAVVHFSVVDLVDVANKIKESAQRHTVEGRCLSQEQLQIRRPLLSAGHCPAPLLVSGLGKQSSEQIPDPEIDGLSPPCAEKGQKCRAPF